MGTAELALERVKTDYLQLCDNGASEWCKSQPFADLVLIHEPGGGCKDATMQQATWRGLETALAQNLTRSIGVSNFVVKDLEAILATAKVPPAANQCAMHIGRHDDATIAFCKAHKIQCFAPQQTSFLCGRQSICLVSPPNRPSCACLRVAGNWLCVPI